ncbi:MAG: cupin domain-containing protein [Promethearchaeota archaeon]
MNFKNIFADLQFSENNPVKKIFLERDNYTIVRISLKKGVKIPAHKGSHSAFFLILKGKGIFTCEGQDIQLGENQYIHIKENEIRGIHALEDLVLFTIKE